MMASDREISFHQRERDCRCDVSHRQSLSLVCQSARSGRRRGVAQWTPTTLVLTGDGAERYRIEGFTPLGDFRARLRLGLGQAAFARGEWDAAAREFRSVAESSPKSDVAPEAVYWAGVSRYKETNDPATLADTRRRLEERYAGSTWAKKASVWG